jgi:hypothetical protein
MKSLNMLLQLQSATFSYNAVGTTGYKSSRIYLLYPPLARVQLGLNPVPAGLVHLQALSKNAFAASVKMNSGFLVSFCINARASVIVQTSFTRASRSLLIDFLES